MNYKLPGDGKTLPHNCDSCIQANQKHDNEVVKNLVSMFKNFFNKSEDDYYNDLIWDSYESPSEK